MKLQILLFSMLMLTGFIHAQEYDQLPTDSARWRAGYTDRPSEPVVTDCEVEIQGDTTIAGMVYAKLIYSFNDSFCGGLRQNENKVYYYGVSAIIPCIGFSSMDSVGEYLLYDFSIEVGDTIFIGKNQSITCVYADSVLVSGEFKKRWYVSDAGVGVEINDVWIEGIGSERGVLAAESNSFEQSAFLVCFEDYGQNYRYPSDCNFASIEHVFLEDDVKIYPNPLRAGEECQLHIPNNGEQLYWRLLTLDGKVYTDGYLEGDQLDIVVKEKGAYIMQLKHKNRHFTSKILIVM